MAEGALVGVVVHLACLTVLRCVGWALSARLRTRVEALRVCRSSTWRQI